ncbi:TPA: hypothetical protein RQO16_005462 [Klebsiella oxytoca]|nr:hypothetical protein [Klebsiella oxytoca]
MTSKLTREQRINEVKELIANAEKWAGFYEHPIHDKPQREMFEGMAKVMSEHLAALAAMDSEPHTDDELSNLLWFSQEATCHSDPNYFCEFQRLATPGFIASIIRELQERRKAAMDSAVYQLWSAGIGQWVECDRQRFDAHSNVPAQRRILYTVPPSTAMDSEPVAWDHEWESCITCEGPQDFKRIIDREAPPEWAIEEGQARNIIPLYRHAQPSPVVPDNRAITQHFDTIALETAREILCDVNRRHELLGGDVQLLSRIQCRIDEACRAAMLQAQSDDDGEPTDDERIMAIEGIHNCERCGDEGWVVGEMGITRCACGQAAPGNSPAIPDGYVMVPKEPTERMVIDGFESEPDETFSEPEVWEAYQKMSGCEQAAFRARLCWAAMIAAAL